jgi:pimeloyl-ACP methyl ester carboxylesterase
MSNTITPTVFYQPLNSNTFTPSVFYRTLNVEGLEIFYREAGPRDAPTVLLLHGFPSSSHMFRNLIPMLAGEYHVIAPDFPGYGESSARRSTISTIPSNG